ncbi:MAG: hypothetical protein HYT87_17345 [Nitrospirae bacterium]|nr:hypothetical protein [Nitrospirota bacterium]
MKRTPFLLALSTALVLAACAVAPAPLVGTLYTNVSYPRQVWHGLETSKRGEACASSILGLVATGDASIEAAKKDAGIHEVASVDHTGSSVLFFYSTYCTIVTGK